MEGLEDYDYGDYVSDNGTDYNSSSGGTDLGTFSSTKSLWTDVLLVVINVIISMIGLGGNALVIWMSGWKMKKTVNTTWYLSLAISDFVFCACLPLDTVYAVTSNWIFGLPLCKLTSFALFLNMFSSVFLLVMISIDRCIIITFPVWSQNHRTPAKASGMVVLIWTLSAALALPALVYRQTKVHGSETKCYNDYMSISRHKAVALIRFVCGFLVPFLVIVFCCLILCMKLRNLTIKSTKAYKVMAALILSFFICWVPYHTFVLVEFDLHKHRREVIETGLKLGGTLAAANSFMNPIIYVFIGNEFKKTFKRSFMSKIENAMADDGRTVTANNSRSNGSFQFRSVSHL